MDQIQINEPDFNVVKHLMPRAVSQLGTRSMLLLPSVMWLRSSHATKLKPKVTHWLHSITQDEDYGLQNQATHQLTRAKSEKHSKKQQVCVFV